MSKITRQTDGKKPTYKQLEDAYILERTKREMLEKAFKDATDELAHMRFKLRMKDK